MAETKTATYKRYNGKDWDTIYFATSASQVGESSDRFFIKPGSNTVNGKQFTENGGITLYSTDIKLSSSDATTVKDAIAQAMGAIPTGVLTTANYATTLDSVYEKKSDATSAHNTLTNKIDNLTTAVNNRYTKTESDNKYQPKGTYATLGTDGKVPSSQLPSYVDDVIEGYYSNGKFYSDSAKTKEITGEGGKIYTDLTSNKTYRWGGTAWVEISASLAIGETAGTAYDGAKGAKNANDIANLKISAKADRDRITSLESNKADKATTLAGYGITDAYTKTEADGKYQPKGNYASATHTHTFDSLTSKPTTLSGYGITDAYTKTETDGKYVTIDTDQTITSTKVFKDTVTFNKYVAIDVPEGTDAAAYTSLYVTGNLELANGMSALAGTIDMARGQVHDKMVFGSTADDMFTIRTNAGYYGGVFEQNTLVAQSDGQSKLVTNHLKLPDVMYNGNAVTRTIATTDDISNRATKIYFEDTVPTSGMVAGDICIEY